MTDQPGVFAFEGQDTFVLFVFFGIIKRGSKCQSLRGPRLRRFTVAIRVNWKGRDPVITHEVREGDVRKIGGFAKWTTIGDALKKKKSFHTLIDMGQNLAPFELKGGPGSVDYVRAEVSKIIDNATASGRDLAEKLGPRN